MRISLRMVKDVLKVVRDIDMDRFTGGGFLDMVDELDDDIINEVCEAITGIKKDYTEDLLEEDGGLEVISDFLLHILDKLKKSTALRKLLETSIGMKLDGLIQKK